MPKQRILNIAVPCPLHRTFDYRLANCDSERLIQPGMRVRVPFGRQKLIGFVIKEVQTSEVPDNKLKTITAVLDDTSLLPSDILDLLFWAARYYAHPLGDVLQTATPVYLRSNDDSQPQLTYVWRAKTVLDQTVEQTADSLKRAPKQQQIYQLLSEISQGLDADALNTLTENWRTPLKNLIEKDLIEAELKPTLLTSTTATTSGHPLTDEQTDVVNTILPTLNQHAVHVLNGVTGSGKTEVYLALCEAALAEQKQILVLVPEIGLTPQLTQRFLQRLDTNIVVLHSAMNDKQRYAAWHAAANNQAQLVIGTRSSIFTPLPNLGLIIIDEEHDGSYKQQDGFRYNARDLAIFAS